EFDVVHLAQYSPRPGTFAAERWPDDVPAEEKRRRINDLLELQREIAGRRTRRWLGRTVEVLVEAEDALGRPYGRNRQGKRVVVKRSVGAERSAPLRRFAPPPPAWGGGIRPGDLVEVVVEESTPGQLAGRPA